MSRVLRELMRAKEPAYSLRIRQLEQKSGYPRIDISLSAELLRDTRLRSESLGFTHRDIDDKELFQGVVVQAKNCDDELHAAYSRIADLLAAINRLPDVTVPTVKPAVVKNLLRTHPPKQVMKLLRYSSVDSFVKRADIKQVMIGVSMHESMTWHRKFVQQLKKVSVSDIIFVKPQAVLIDQRLMHRYTPPPYVYAKVLGIVGLHSHLDDVWLHTAAQALQSLRHLQIEGVLAKLRFYTPEFLDFYRRWVYHPMTACEYIGSVAISWHALYDAIARDTALLASSEAPMSETDFRVPATSELLDKLTKSATFFRNSELLGTKDVSFHINDVALNLQYTLPLHGSSYVYRAKAIERHLLAMYVSHGVPNSVIRRYVGAE